MNLQPVKTYIGGHSAKCVECGTRRPLSELFADHDGVPFVDYYCAACANAVQRRREVENVDQV